MQTRFKAMSRLVLRVQPPLLLCKPLESANVMLFSKRFMSVGVDLKTMSRLVRRCLPPLLLHGPLESAIFSK
jgi:hypothetical protein